MAKVSQTREISAWAEQRVDPWEGYLHFSDPFLTTTWQHYELAATATGSDPDAGFRFGLGQAIGSVWLDDVQLHQGNQNVWRRDYENGVVLVNSTDDTHTINLGGTFQKINGTQAPVINDGSRVTQVDLPPRDGLILLRPGGQSGDGLAPKRPQTLRRVVVK